MLMKVILILKLGLGGQSEVLLPLECNEPRTHNGVAR